MEEEALNPTISSEEKAPMPPLSYDEGKKIPMTLYEKNEAKRIGLMGCNTNEDEWNDFCKTMQRKRCGAYPVDYFDVVLRDALRDVLSIALEEDL